MPRRAARRGRLSPLTVIGELLLLSGLAVFGYIVWQPWYTGVVVAGQQVELSSQVSAGWAADWAAESDTQDRDEPWDGTVPVAPLVAQNEVFGVLYVPAFDPTFQNVIAEGTSEWGVLNPWEKGVGRYSSTQLPGEIGNVALAAHRSGAFTTPFRHVMNLRIGDPLFIETQDGWYTYRFRSLEYVLPSENEVLFPFPRLTGVPGEDKILTLTTCHPENLGIDERAIAYSVFESFQPRSEGPPAELVKLNPDVTGA